MSAIITSVISAVAALIAVAASVWTTTGIRGLRRQFREHLLKDRVDAYRALWTILEPLSPTDEMELSHEQRQALAEQLRGWYYQDGYGIYLSEMSRAWFNAGRTDLKGEASLERVRDAFSLLRSHLKDDIGVFGQGEWEDRAQRRMHPRSRPPEEKQPKE